MFVTVRQLEDLYRRDGSNGHVTLPYRARLTPLAQDWVRAKRVTLGYNDTESQKPESQKATIRAQEFSAQHAGFATPTPSGATLWWCDGPCGPAKAALTAFEKESPLAPLDVPPDARQVATVIRTIASQVKSNHASGAVLMVRTGAAAIVFANRCPSLRAILGTCLEAVEQGIQQVGANVLVIEYPHQTLQQMKNTIGRFVRAKKELPEDVRRQLQELASCG